MQYILVTALSYLLGCSNMATYIAAAKKVDLSAGGSGNPGASNAVILMGWGAGVLTQSLILPLILLVASAVIAWKHRENYVRMMSGTEIRFRRAGRGEYRVK